LRAFLVYVPFLTALAAWAALAFASVLAAGTQAQGNRGA
jgi:hypothetical protein